MRSLTVNCRHTFFSWNPKLNIDRGQTISEEESKERYDLEQKQRAIERRMRDIKREIEAQKQNDTDEGIERLKVLRSRLKDVSDKYMDFCKTNGLKPRNYALKIQ